MSKQAKTEVVIFIFLVRMSRFESLCFCHYKSKLIRNGFFQTGNLFKDSDRKNITEKKERKTYYYLFLVDFSVFFLLFCSKYKTKHILSEGFLTEKQNDV